ncbi:hypothetical protein YC2023_086476 [Brassica napus]
MSGPCGSGRVLDANILWVDSPAAETKLYCSVHHGCRYIRMNIREKVYRGLHLLLEILTLEHLQCKTPFFPSKWSKNENGIKLLQPYFISHSIMK